MSFNPLAYPLCFKMPHYLSDVASWHKHIPFAFTVVQMLKPGVFVELGTHKGDSYLAFCQAVDALGINTSCFAVDTWEGDEQAGHYNATVFEELRDYHDNRYGGFSTLLKCCFDEALWHFSDGSIDLLHIDGLHTYEAVKHDFETWLPKMSEKGVMLLHDTFVRENDFGVWKLLEEIRNRFPGFEFTYGHGLAVVAVGKIVPEELKCLLSSTQQELYGIMECFHSLGSLVSLSHTTETYEKDLSRLREELLVKDQLLAKDEQEIVDLRQRLSYCISYEQELQVSNTQEKTELEKKIADKTRELEDHEQQLAALSQENAAVNHRLKDCVNREKQLLNSYSWRITAPLRLLCSKLKGAQ